MNFDNQKTWWHLFGRYSTYEEKNITFTHYLSQRCTYKWNKFATRYILVQTLVRKAVISHHVHTQETANTYNQMSQFANWMQITKLRLLETSDNKKFHYFMNIEHEHG